MDNAAGYNTDGAICRLLLAAACCIALLATLGRCQCPAGSTSFEKVSGWSLRGAPLSPVYKGSPGEISITRECLARCRALADCSSLLLSYAAQNCMKSDQNSEGERRKDLAVSNPPGSTSYFEKICLTAPRCPRAWTFERVVGFELSGFDDRSVAGVGSRLQCEELCLRERAFACRSGEYDYAFGQCRLSSEDRRSQPSSFRPAFGDVDYFENQCVPDGSTGCDYEERADSDVERVDAALTAASASECQQACDSTQAFLCHAYSFRREASACKLSSDDTYNLGAAAVRRKVGTAYFQRANCLDLKLTCTESSMQLVLRTRDPFDGRIYAQSKPYSCQAYGDKQRVTRFVMDVKGQCGVELEFLLKIPTPNHPPDSRTSTNYESSLHWRFPPESECSNPVSGEDRLANTVVIQYHPLIQQKGDRVIRLYCSLVEEFNRTVTKTFRVAQGVEPAATAVVNATAPTPNIRLRITDANGTDITGTRIGEPLYFRIEIDEDSVFGIFARDMTARNGRGDLQITLIDADGCSTDSGIFPAFQKVPGTKSLQSRFQAFKFSEDPVVRFQVQVHFCLEECNPVVCPGGTESWGKRRRRSEGEMEDGEPPIVPDYPLMAAIVVEGASPFGNSSSGDPLDSQFVEDRRMSDELVCTTKTVVVVTSLGALFLQIGLLAACATCLLLTRTKGSPTRYPDDIASTITETLPPFASGDVVCHAPTR